MNISKFTQKSIEAVNNLEKVAYQFGHQEIEEEHLLYSLLHQEDSLIAKLIEKMEIQKEYFEDRLDQALNGKVKVSGGSPYIGQYLNKALVSAEDVAKQMGDEYVSVEHLFLSILNNQSPSMKQFFKGCDLPVLDGMWFARSEWTAGREGVLSRIESTCPYPVYVKPANLGSSIGISRATDRPSLIKAIETAVEYDRRILVERGIEKPREINCSALRVKGEVRSSLCEMPASWEEFLTFDDKYLRGSKSGKGQGMESLARKVPAPIGDELTARIQRMTREVYQAMDCKGVVRIDYMLEGDELYINEINMIPGSLAFYLWEPLGISFSDMLDCMIEDAFAAHAEKNRSVFSYDSSILKSVQGGAKGAKGGKLGGSKLHAGKLG